MDILNGLKDSNSSLSNGATCNLSVMTERFYFKIQPYSALFTSVWFFNSQKFLLSNDKQKLNCIF